MTKKFRKYGQVENIVVRLQNTPTYYVKYGKEDDRIKTLRSGKGGTGRQKITILIRMQFLNHIIKSEHGFKTTQKFHKFRVFIKTLNL